MADSKFQNPMPQAPGGGDNYGQALHKMAVLVGEALIEGTSASGGGGPLAVPGGQESFSVTYYGATNNIQTITYQPSGRVQTLTYVNGGAADDDNILTATIS